LSRQKKKKKERSLCALGFEKTTVFLFFVFVIFFFFVTVSFVSAEAPVRNEPGSSPEDSENLRRKITLYSQSSHRIPHRTWRAPIQLIWKGAVRRLTQAPKRNGRNSSLLIRPTFTMQGRIVR